MEKLKAWLGWHKTTKINITVYELLTVSSVQRWSSCGPFILCLQKNRKGPRAIKLVFNVSIASLIEIFVVFSLLHHCDLLKFNIECFGQQQAEAASSHWDDAIHHHGNTIMVDLREPDQWWEYASHTSTHGVEADSTMSTKQNNRTKSKPFTATVSLHC